MDGPIVTKFCVCLETNPRCIGHFKETEVLIFVAGLGFSHYLVHLMLIGTILSVIDQYLDLPHRL